MTNIFSITKSITTKSSTAPNSHNVVNSTFVIIDPANCLKNKMSVPETQQNKNDLEELDEIDRKAIFSSSL